MRDGLYVIGIACWAVLFALMMAAPARADGYSGGATQAEDAFPIAIQTPFGGGCGATGIAPPLGCVMFLGFMRMGRRHGRPHS